MADRYTQVVILCEDYMHFNFVRRYLIQPGDRAAANSRQRGSIRPRSRLAVRDRELSR